MFTVWLRMAKRAPSPILQLRRNAFRHWSCCFENSLVLPELQSELLPQFGRGEITLDALTRQYVHAHLEYQFACVPTSAEAYALEAECRRGPRFEQKPFLNPL